MSSVEVQNQGSSLYDKIGSFTIPTDTESLRGIFELYDVDPADDTIDREHFVASLVQYEAEMGLQVMPSYIDGLIPLAAGGDRLSWGDFQIVMLKLASQ